MSDRVLIIGAAGFIGLHLARRFFKEGYEVDLVDNFARGTHDLDFKKVIQEPHANFFSFDCVDLENFKSQPVNYSYIFNLEAIVGVANVIRQPYRVLVDNLKIMDNVISFARKQKNLKRFLYPSTSEVTAGTLKNFGLIIPTPENTPLTITELNSPRTSYMLSKINGELMTQFSDIPYTIFRPHNIYGPRMGDDHVIPGQLKKAFFAKDGESVFVPSVNHTRCFCYIDDAIEQLMRIIKEPLTEKETLNLGTESPEVTILKVSEICHATVGRKVLIKTKPDTIGSPQRRAPSMIKTNSLIKYSSQINLEEGILRTYKWYYENIFNNPKIFS